MSTPDVLKFPPWPLTPVYCSLEERDKHRKIIVKLLDANFGKVWRSFIQIKYAPNKMQHRPYILELRPEELTNLTEYKIRGLNNQRRAYLSKSIEILKFYYVYGEEDTLSHIEGGHLRYKNRKGEPVIKDEISPEPSKAPDNKPEEDTEPPIKADAVNLSELPTRTETTMDIKDVTDILTKKSNV